MYIIFLFKKYGVETDVNSQFQKGNKWSVEQGEIGNGSWSYFIDIGLRPEQDFASCCNYISFSVK